MATSAQLLEAIKASGWKICRKGPGMYYAVDPSSEIEHPTPDYVPKHWWPRCTYTRLRHLSFNASGQRITAAWAEEGTPWTGTQSRKLTFKAAIEYLAGESS